MHVVPARSLWCIIKWLNEIVLIFFSFDVFRIGVKSNPNGPCLGRRTPDGYVFETFEEVERRIIRLGCGLVNLKLCPERTFTDEAYGPAQRLRSIGVLMKNRPEWIILEQAVNVMGLTLIPLYDTLGEDAMCFIVEQTRKPAMRTDC